LSKTIAGTANIGGGEGNYQRYTLTLYSSIIIANNIYQLLKLANRFQVDFLRKRCEAHLIHCVEMPLMERLIYADAYHLDKLKVFLLRYPKILFI